MTWLFSQVWLWVLVSALLGFAITLFAMIGPARSARPAVRPARSDRNERSRSEPAGERSRHRAALTDESDDTGETVSTDTGEVAARPVAGATSAAAAASPEPTVEPAVTSRRRRRYDVDDVEVSAWEPGATFAASVARTD